MLQRREGEREHIRRPHTFENEAHSRRVELAGPVDAGRLADLLEHPPVGAVRLKGVVDVRFGQASVPWVVHVVSGTVHVERLRQGTTVRAMVVIGHDLDEVEAERTLRALLDDPATPGSGAGRFRRLVRLSR